MATLGNTTEYAGDQSGASASVIGQKFTMTEDGTLTDFWWYGFGFASTLMRFAVYTDEATMNLVWASGEVAPNSIDGATPTWTRVTGASGALSNGASYWLVWNSDSTDPHFRYNGSGVYPMYSGMVYGAFPATLARPGTNWSYANVSVYITYSTGGVAVTPVPTQTTGTYSLPAPTVYIPFIGSRRNVTITFNWEDTDTDISYISCATGKGTTLLNVVKPSGTVDNDIMFMVLGIHDTSATPTIPEGWTLIDSEVGTLGQALSYWKRASGEGASYDITDCADACIATILTFRDCIASGSPIDNNSIVDNASGVTGGASITTGVADCAIISAVIAFNGGEAFSSWSATNPATLTEREDAGTAFGSGIAIGVATDRRETAGATGATAYTLSIAAENIAIVCALIPT